MRRHAKASSAGTNRRRRIFGAIGMAAVLVLVLAVAPASAVAPTVAIDAPTDVSYTSAKLSGELDPGDNDTYYSFEYAIAGSGSWSGFQALGPIAANSGNQALPPRELTELPPGTEYEARLVANNFIDPEVLSAEPNPTFTTDPVPAPVVSIDPVTAITGDSAHFSGTIEPGTPAGNPEAFEVNWRFECTPACPGLKGTITPDSSEPEAEVEADASGLEPNTGYAVRLVASNVGGQGEAGPVSFKTSQPGPEVQTLYAGALATEGATLAGQVNPKNSPATYQFEWGTDASYGNLAPASPEALGVANNALNVVTVPLTGLEPGTTYHFRLVATNTETSAVSEGLDHTFTTLEPAGPPAPCANAAVRSQQSSGFLLNCRAYEKVSPADKGALSVVRSFGDRAISADGTRASFLASGVPPGSESNNGSALAQFASRNAQAGWASQSIEPPFLPSTEDPYGVVHDYSEDLTHSTVISTAVLAPGGLHGLRNLYLRNNLDGSYQAITAVPGPPIEPYAAGISTDSRSVAFMSEYAQTADPGITPDYLYPYVWRDGTVHLAAILPNGDVPPFGALAGSGLGFGNMAQAFSRDGKRLVFHVRAKEEDPGAPSGSVVGQLYVRTEDGVNPPSTAQVNASQRAVPDPAGPLPALYWLAEAEHGSKVLFSSCEKLTEDSTADASDSGCTETRFPEPAQGSDLYLFDVESGETTDLTAADPSGSGFLGVVGASDDLSSVYFAATGVLDEGALAGRPNLYLWEAGQARFIAALSQGDEANWSSILRADSVGNNREKVSRVSASGDFALITSRVPLTGYDNVAASGSCGADENGTVLPKDCAQVFRYDAGAGQLSCVSCPAQGADPLGDASLFRLFGGSSLFSQLPRNLSDDGGTVFFQALAPLVASDVNEKQDVYEWSAGEVQLVSSGVSSEDSYFFDATPSGSDVLFRTQSQLTGADRDDVADVYDARIGGGFFEQAPPTPCSGDGCRSALGAPPASPSPATTSFSGAGNASKPPKCARNKVKRKGKCVSRKQKKQRRSGKRAAGKNRGGAK